MSNIVLEFKNITKKFHTGGFIGGKDFTAVDDVSFYMRKGEIISLIGESGSGKTTIGRMLLKLLKPSGGEILIHGKSISDLNKKETKKHYHKVQAVFQEPFSSFNPLYKVDRIFNMVLNVYMPDVSKIRKKELIDEALQDVNLEPCSILGKYPHQLSGGQLQRILIARALLLHAEILVADELISMLDASTRIGVLNLLGKLAKEKGLSVIFITHDLSLGYYISDYSLIMYRGRIIEMGETATIYNDPIHPYTRLLLRSVPDVGLKWDQKEDFNPDIIDKEIKTFYDLNKDKEKGIVQLSDTHWVILNG